MIIGKMRHKIDVQYQNTPQNDFGEPIDNWTTLLSNIWANIQPKTGKEFLDSDKTNGKITHEIRIRYRESIITQYRTNRLRIKHCSRYFEVISPPVNFGERNRDLMLVCEEVFS